MSAKASTTMAPLSASTSTSASKSKVTKSTSKSASKSKSRSYKLLQQHARQEACSAAAGLPKMAPLGMTKAQYNRRLERSSTPAPTKPSPLLALPVELQQTVLKALLPPSQPVRLELSFGNPEEWDDEPHFAPVDLPELNILATCRALHENAWKIAGKAFNGRLEIAMAQGEECRGKWLRALGSCPARILGAVTVIRTSDVEFLQEMTSRFYWEVMPKLVTVEVLGSDGWVRRYSFRKPRALEFPAIWGQFCWAVRESKKLYERWKRAPRIGGIRPQDGPFVVRDEDVALSD